MCCWFLCVLHLLTQCRCDHHTRGVRNNSRTYKIYIYIYTHIHIYIYIYIHTTLRTVFIIDITIVDSAFSVFARARCEGGSHPSSQKSLIVHPRTRSPPVSASRATKATVAGCFVKGARSCGVLVLENKRVSVFKSSKIPL